MAAEIPTVDNAARTALRGLATGQRLKPMLRRLLLDALVNQDRSDRPRDPSALASSAARSATQWIGSGLEEREKALLELLTLADGLPPQPKRGPAFPDKISSVDKVLADAGIPHAFGGALAVGYYGEPRATGDIDLNVFIAISDWHRLKVPLRSLGSGVEIEEPEGQGVDQLKLEWGATPLHLFFSSDALHERMNRKTRAMPFNGSLIPMIAPEHLVIRKAILDRPKDWYDIEQILVATDPLELGEIETWLTTMVGEDNPRMKRLAEVKAALSLG